MPEPTEPNQPTIETTPPLTTEAPPTAVDPREYELLQRQLDEARSVFTTLDPHADRIKWLVEDPEAARLVDNARKAYEQYRHEQEPLVPPDQKPIYDKVSKLEKFVDDYTAQQQAAREAPQKQFAQAYDQWQHNPANERFYQRLVVDHPDLQRRDIQYLAQVAADNNFSEPLEAVWKKEGWRFTQQPSSAPPTSLRTDAGEPGTAGNATGGETSLRSRVIQLERERRGIA